MKYRLLGKSGLRVSEVGFGTWGLGGTAYGEVDDKVSSATLMAAYERGVNFYDTSDMYGDGHSEELLGKVFQRLRNQVVLATKGGNLPHTGLHMPQDFSASYLTRALEGSLRRLRTDAVDVYQLHSPFLSELEALEEVISLLQLWVREGKIRAYGVSVRSPKDGLVAIEQFGFSVVQVNFNMMDQRALDSGLLDMAVKNQVGLIARTPLVFGYLTGTLTGDEKMPSTDHRRNWPADQRKRWAKSSNLFDFLSLPYQRTTVQAALRFCLDHEAISTVIPGMMTPEQVEENTQASEMPSLSAVEREKIKTIYLTNEFYDPSSKQRGQQ